MGGYPGSVRDIRGYPELSGNSDGLIRLVRGDRYPEISGVSEGNIRG